MENLSKDLSEFIALLNRHKVRFLLVGGFAVAFHGYPRNTGDIDFFIEASTANAKRVLKAVKDFGFGKLDITLSDLAKAGTIIQLGFPPNRIDLITKISGVSFAQCWDSKESAHFYGHKIFIISKKDLIKNKRASGRPKDRLDINELKS